jgi:drug/metabolite transporter (DMT)-like permease
MFYFYNYMNITIVLAQVLGISFLVMGISMLVNKKTVLAALQEITREPGVLWLWGIIALLIGAVFVALNNVWTGGLPLFVTVMGWLALLKGVFILFFPRTAVAMYRKLEKESWLMAGGLVVLVIGLILLYQGLMY